MRIEWSRHGAFVAHRDNETVVDFEGRLKGLGWHAQTRLVSYCDFPYQIGSGWYTIDPASVWPVREHIQCYWAMEKMREFEQRIKAASSLGSDFEVPVPDGLSLYPFQRAGVQRILSRRGTLLADEMGVGKTVQVIGALNCDEPERALIICPSSLKENWRRELMRWLTYTDRVQVLNSTTDEIDLSARITVVNYDLLAYRPSTKAAVAQLEALVARKREVANTGDDTSELDGDIAKVRKQLEELRNYVTLAERLAKVGYDFVACDEAHKLKNEDAKRTAAILGTPKKGPGLIAKAKRIVLATGTPILNSVPEVWPLLQALDPGVYDDKNWFLGRYAVRIQKEYWRDGKRHKRSRYTGARNTEELNARLCGTVMVRRLKQDVLTELPPKTRSMYIVPADAALLSLADEEATAHDEAEAIRAEIEAIRSSPDSSEQYESKLKSLRDGLQLKMSQMSRARSKLAERKLPLVLATLSEFLESTDKLVFFAHHKALVQGVFDHFRDHAVLIDGGVSNSERTRAVDRFQNDPEVKLFVGSIEACGVGYTLTAASHVVFGELAWTPALNVQAEDRCHRLSQVNPVNVYLMVVDRSIDSRIARRLVEKQRIADAVLDGLEGA